MAIAFYIDSFMLVLKFTFQGFKKMVLFAGVDFVRMLLILIIVLIGLKLNYGLLSPIIAYIITPTVLILIFGWIFLKNIFPRFFKTELVFDRKILKKVTKYGIFVLVTNVGTIILGYTDIMVLTFFSGLTSVGLYSVALPTAMLFLYFPRAVGGVLLPLTSELWVKKKKRILREGIESLYKYSLIIIIPLVFIVLSFSDLVINILYGGNYLEASNALKILAIGMIFATLFIINTKFFSGIGKPEIVSKIVYIASIFNLIFNLILIPIFGLMGAAVTTTISYFIMMVLGLIKIKGFINIELPIKLWIKTAIIGVIFISIITFLKGIITTNVWIETAIVLIISGLIYIILLFLLKVINMNELKDLYKRIAK